MAGVGVIGGVGAGGYHWGGGGGGGPGPESIYTYLGRNGASWLSDVLLGLAEKQGLGFRV